MDLETQENKSECKPILRWAGGKGWLLKHLDEIVPANINTYIEPFMGGGAFFFHFNGRIKKAILADSNSELINTYSTIKDNATSVIKEIKKYKNTEEFYYKLRSKKKDDPIKASARFIFLNKTSFNGLYRVNKNGEYNVPFGYRLNIDFTNSKGLMLASHALRKAKLYNQDFAKTLKRARKGDLVFIDPPYTVAHENNGFIQYNQKIFTLEDQKRLADLLYELNKKGVYYILTNAKHDSIKKIYKKLGSPIQIGRSSTIGGKMAKRGTVSEYIFTNLK